MMRVSGLFAMSVVALFASAQANGNAGAVVDAAKAGPDFAIQGEYTGNVKREDGEQAKTGVQVIAMGHDVFRAVLCRGGLPGDGWDRKRSDNADGKRANGVVELKLNGGKWRATIRDGVMEMADANGRKIGELKRVIRESPTLGKKSPAGAVVLFDGSSADGFVGGRLSKKGLLMQGMTSKRKFKSCRMHEEFRLPFEPLARGQGRGNSGCYVQVQGKTMTGLCISLII